MHEQVRLATAVCAGKAVLDTVLFGPLPRHNADAPTEADGSMVALKDVMYAFASGLYAPIYGRASARPRFSYHDTIKRSVEWWSNSVTKAYQEVAGPAAFRRLFFEGGLWRVFVDRLASPEQNLRRRLEQATDFRALKADPDALAVVNQAHPFFLRTPPAKPLAHTDSHADAARFANTVLDIGETELALRSPEDKEQLLAGSLSELRRPALLEITGVNFATSFLRDGRSGLYKRSYLTIDDRQPRVGFNMDAIQSRIEEEFPDIATYNHRGCPVLYQTTPFDGQETPVFSVMEGTLLRMYRDTGALSVAALRPLV